MTPSWLTDAWNWIVNNPLFSGAGGTVLAALFGWLFSKKQHRQQTAITHNCGNVIQATENGRSYSVGDGSTIIVNEGVSQKELQKTLAIHNEEINNRCIEFENKLYIIIASIIHIQKKLSFPEILFSIKNAEKQYIRTSDEETRKLLLNAVKMRIESSENSIIAANMDLIVDNILFLTSTQMKIIFLLCAIKYFPIIANNFEEFKNNIEEIASEVLQCNKITIVDLNGIVAHGFMVDNLLAMMWNSEIRVGYYMVQCNKRVFEENLFDISDDEKITGVVKIHFEKLNCANDILTALNFKELSCTYAGIILTDLIFSAKFPHIRHASLEEVLDSLK